MAQKRNFDTSKSYLENVLYTVICAMCVRQGRLAPSSVTDAQRLYTDVFSQFTPDDYAAFPIQGIKGGTMAPLAQNAVPVLPVASVLANATDLASSEALVNDLKIKLNAVISVLTAYYV